MHDIQHTHDYNGRPPWLYMQHMSLIANVCSSLSLLALV
jgi:hypothetical protein